ncbi:MAG: thiamine phosphate synthase [Candidatus Firestonebacteria bacterium]
MTSKKEYLKKLNKSLYVIIDPDFCRLEPLETARRAILGGARVFQLRCKNKPESYTVKLAGKMASLCRSKRAIFIMNDSPDIAEKVKADGLHIGQKDVSALKAKGVFKGLLGVSAYNDKEIRKALREGADYIGFGPVFKTSTKKGLPPVKGLKRLARAARKFKVPVVAIGGINSKNIAEIFKAKAASASLISAVCSADDPKKAVRELIKKII